MFDEQGGESTVSFGTCLSPVQSLFLHPLLLAISLISSLLHFQEYFP